MKTLNQLLDHAETTNRIEQSVTEIIDAMEQQEAIAHLQSKMIALGFTPEVCEALVIKWRYTHGAEALVTIYGAKVRIFDTTYAGGGWYARKPTGFDLHFSKDGSSLLNAVMLHLVGIRRAYKERGL